jgi:hypothetical protein
LILAVLAADPGHCWAAIGQTRPEVLIVHVRGHFFELIGKIAGEEEQAAAKAAAVIASP